MVPERAVQTIAAQACHGSARVTSVTNGVMTAANTAEAAIWVMARVAGATFAAKKPVVMMCSP